MQRLGILTPSSNTVLEPATIRLLEPLRDQLSVHFARFRVTQVSDEPASHGQFALAPMLEAARLLADARVDALLWAGTAAAWEGIETDEQLVATIEDATDRPATTATLSLLAAFRALSVRRYALVVPYVESIVDAIVANLDAAGYACVASDHDSLLANWEFASVAAGAIAARVRKVARSTPDAVVIHCTNLRGAEVSEALEAELGIPVLDSVVVGLWGALDLLGIDPPAIGFGALASVHGLTVDA
jgi:maleate isomerase